MLTKKLLIILGLTALTSITSAQSFPDKPITLVVPNPPGGLVDTSARLLSEPLTRVIGQTVLVDNKPGASGNIAYQFVANAKPDGYTLLISYSGYHVGNPALMDKLPWDPVKDFSPIALLTVSTNVIAVHPSVPVNNLKEFIAYAKANSGKINYASSGSGTSPHLAGEMFKTMTGVSMMHIPYKGNAPVLNDLLAGQVDAHFGLVPGMLPYIKSGKLRALAVTTKTRVASLPDVPTIMELGYPNYEINSWQGLFAPANTPPEIIAKLHEATSQILNDSEFRGVLTKEGSEPVGGSVAQFTTHVTNEVNKWAKVVKDSGAQAD